MLHVLTLFLAPAATQPQATTKSPPAPPGTGWQHSEPGAAAWKLALSVLGNAAGFVALLAGCWLTLQVMVTLVQP